MDLYLSLEGILADTLRLVSADSARIYLQEGGRLPLHAGREIQSGKMKAVQAHRALDDLAGGVANSGLPIFVPDLRSHPVHKDQQLAAAVAILPLRQAGRVRGTLQIIYAEPHQFDTSEMSLLALAANHAALAVENAELRAELCRFTMETEQRVEERTAELQAANEALRLATEELRELDVRKNEFVSNISHQLRTPLTNLKLYLGLLENGKPERRIQYMSVLRHEVDQLQSLIQDLLQLCRLDLGKTRPAFAPVNLNEVLTTHLADYASALAGKGLTLHTYTESSLPPVSADERMLAQIFQNLMSNAVNYTPRGGRIMVRTELRKTQAAESGEGEQVWATFSVTDTGPGVSQEEQSHLFERFFRGEAARMMDTPGTGLGLAICQELVKTHNGHILVDSQVGRGSTFRVWLPAQG